ncbi:MAG: hypothetical protein WD295_00430 [Bacteroidota bacterium]
MTETNFAFEADVQERPLKDSVRDYEREVITAALKAHGDDKRKVA